MLQLLASLGGISYVGQPTGSTHWHFLIHPPEKLLYQALVSACLLAQGEEAEKEHCSECLAEQMILEEFGRCLSQILHIEFKSKGLKIE